jgi:NAD-dependent dihydropyrimidine dehydrogenase PreA subunit
MPAIVDKEKCEGCEDCLESCPSSSIVMAESKAQVNEDCIDCGACVESCPTQAISMAD